MNACTTTVDKNGIPYNERVKQLRNRVGKTSDQVMTEVDMTFLDYEDLENFAGELTQVVSLATVAKLARALGIRPGQIFEDFVQERGPIAPKELVTKIQTHLTAKNLGVDQFEDQVGFAIGESLSDASKVMDWNVDCLRFVCAEIGVDWLSALPEIS